MFAALSTAASSFLDVTWSDQDEPCLADNLEDILSFDVPDLPELRLPSAHGAVSAMYSGLLRPLYRCVRDTIADDVQSITQALQEVDLSSPSVTQCTGKHSSLAVENIQVTLTSQNTLHIPHGSGYACPRDVSNQGFVYPDPEVVATPGAGPSRPVRIESFDVTKQPPKSRPSVPLITVTPAPDQEREKSSWVPLQDDCFGSQLTVPTHRALNSVHPPMIPTSSSTVMHVQHWRYKQGHWWAALPDLEEQEKREIYSRPRVRRGWRCGVVSTNGKRCDIQVQMKDYRKMLLLRRRQP